LETQVRHRVLFSLFFISGACGLLYQIVWLRLAFASFGVITPVLSVVVAIFMAGLALGSWGAGKWVSAWSRRTGLSAIYFYAAAEIIIGLSAFAVPAAFRVGESWLLPLGETDSFAYLLYSALILGSSILPACIAMGTTYPLMLAYVKEVAQDEDSSFSFLYMANVLGASVGTLLTAVALVELFGFRTTLLIAGWPTSPLPLARSISAVVSGIRSRATRLQHLRTGVRQCRCRMPPRGCLCSCCLPPVSAPWAWR